MKTKLNEMALGAKCLVLGAMVAVGLVATAAEPEAVQLWEGGPYWATVNVGTSEVQDHLEYGGLYTFGEAAQAVTDALGTGWRLPTKEDFDKLVSDEYCISVWDDTKKGYTFTSKSDSSKSIFLPAAGRDDGMGREDTAGTLGNYWSSMENGPGEAWGLRFSMNEGASASPIGRTLGIRVSVRAVKDPPLPITLGEVKSHEPWDGKFDVEYTLKGLEADVEYKVAFDVKADSKSASVTNAAAKLANGTYTNTLNTVELFGKEVVDTKAKVKVSLIATEKAAGVKLWADGPIWATVNVGTAEDGQSVAYGALYKFSEDEAKTAAESLGEGWRLPTKDELGALLSNCGNGVWTEQNGVKGRLFTGKGDYSSNSIFLPAAGFNNGNGWVNAGIKGYYWTSTRSNQYSASALNFGEADSGDTGPRIDSTNTSLGYSVRAVRDAGEGGGGSEEVVATAEKEFRLGPSEGSEGNPWKVGGTGHEGEVEAWTNGTELVIQGAGTITNLAEVIEGWDDIKAGIAAINVSSNGVTGAEAQAFAGIGTDAAKVALTLPDGWQGAFPTNAEGKAALEGYWYGAAVNMSVYPLTVRNVTFAQRWPWNGLVEIGFGVTGPEGETNVVITVMNGETEVTNFTAAVTVPEGGVLTTNLVWDAATAGLATNFKSEDVTVEVAFQGGSTGPAVDGVQLWADGPYWATVNVGSAEQGMPAVFGALYQFAGATNEVAKLGDGWRLPTKEEFGKLLDDGCCSRGWQTIDTVKGYVITSKADSSKSIFFPSAGSIYDSAPDKRDTDLDAGSYWSSSVNLASGKVGEFSFNNITGAGLYELSTNRYASVRAVKDPPQPASDIAAKSEVGALDLREEVALAEGEVTVSNVTYSATAWGAADAAVKLGWTNETTGAVGELATGLTGEGVTNAVLPKKDGAYKLTHLTGDLMSFVSFTVNGYPLGCETNPWVVGGDADQPENVVTAWTNGTGQVFFKPVRGVVTKTGLETITNAMGGASFEAKLIAADGSVTNDLVMVAGASGTAYGTLAEALVVEETSYTLYEVPNYVVSYDGGEGALGTMSVDKFIPDSPTNLTANAYEIIGYEFKGWTTNGTAVAYTNRHEGVNFVQPGETLSLTARWEQVTTVPADYAELTNMIAKATRPVTFTLEADIEFPADGKIEISMGKVVTFVCDGKFHVTNTIPTLHREIIVGEGLGPEDFGRFVVTDEDVKAYYETEGGRVVLRARGESEDFPWKLGEGVEAWMNGDTLLAKPERGTASVATLVAVTNALGHVPSSFKVISAGGTATNEVQMLLGSDSKAYDNLEQVFAAEPMPDTVRLFEVKGYWVSYDRGGNDGQGEPQPDGAYAIPDMATDMFIQSVPTNLTANAYVRTNFVFDCWLGWTNGVMVTHLDEAADIDFCEPGATLALTAQWTRVIVPVTVTNLEHTTVSVTTNGIEIAAKSVSTNVFGAGTSIYNVLTNADVTIVYRAVSGWAFHVSGTNGTVVLSNVAYDVESEGCFVPADALPTVVPIEDIITVADIIVDSDGKVIVKSSNPTADGVLIIPPVLHDRGVIAIADQAFQYATWLRELVIEEGLSEIGNAAFDNCSGLERVVIPASVTNVGQVAFMRCFALKTLEFKGDAPTMQKLAGLGYGICWGAHGFEVKIDPGATGWDDDDDHKALNALCAGWQTFSNRVAGVYTCTYDPEKVVPRITGVERLTRKGATLTINNVKNGLTYKLMGAEKLDGEWTELKVEVGGDADTLVFAIPDDTGASKFFRVTVSE